MNVGPPSSGKSPGSCYVLKTLRAIDARLDAEFRELKQKFELEMEVYKNAPPAEKPPLPSKPAVMSAVVDDATIETLPPHLNNSPRGLLSFHDEGSAWAASFGQYKNGKGADRQFWLFAFSGEAIRIDRKGSLDQGPIRVPNPFLSVLGNLPPDMVRSLCDAQGRSDGFLERILFA